MSITGITYSRVRVCACARIRAIAPPDGRNGRYTPTQGPTGIIYHPEPDEAVQTPSRASEAAMPLSSDYPPASQKANHRPRRAIMPLDAAGSVNPINEPPEADRSRTRPLCGRLREDANPP